MAVMYPYSGDAMTEFSYHKIGLNSLVLNSA